MRMNQSSDWNGLNEDGICSVMPIATSDYCNSLPRVEATISMRTTMRRKGNPNNKKRRTEANGEDGITDDSITVTTMVSKIDGDGSKKNKGMSKEIRFVHPARCSTVQM